VLVLKPRAYERSNATAVTARDGVDAWKGWRRRKRWHPNTEVHSAGACARVPSVTLAGYQEYTAAKSGPRSRKDYIAGGTGNLPVLRTGYFPSSGII